MKKFISLFLAVVLVFSLTATVSAETNIEITPFYLYTGSMTNSLIITGNTASCKTVVTGLSTVTKIETTQYLQIQSGNSWVNVSGASWSSSATSTRLSMTNEKSGLSSGTYRLYAESTVYSGTNSEKVTGYSNSVTI